jgi:hypothetical protein
MKRKVPLKLGELAGAIREALVVSGYAPFQHDIAESEGFFVEVIDDVVQQVTVVKYVVDAPKKKDVGLWKKIKDRKRRRTVRFAKVLTERGFGVRREGLLLYVDAYYSSAADYTFQELELNKVSINSVVRSKHLKEGEPNEYLVTNVRVEDIVKEKKVGKGKKEKIVKEIVGQNTWVSLMGMRYGTILPREYEINELVRSSYAWNRSLTMQEVEALFEEWNALGRREARKDKATVREEAKKEEAKQEAKAKQKATLCNDGKRFHLSECTIIKGRAPKGKPVLKGRFLEGVHVECPTCKRSIRVIYFKKTNEYLTEKHKPLKAENTSKKEATVKKKQPSKAKRKTTVKKTTKTKAGGTNGKRKTKKA